MIVSGALPGAQSDILNAHHQRVAVYWDIIQSNDMAVLPSVAL
jgi:hypothetical protein